MKYIVYMSIFHTCDNRAFLAKCYAEQVNALIYNRKSLDSPYFSTYNPNWWNHPNIYWI